jgi:protein TonB
LESVIRLVGSRIPVPAFYARMDYHSRVMTLAVGASILLHASVLFLQFSFPDGRFRKAPPSLDVVLVNSKSSARPFHADAMAQANLDGGGNTDEKRRAKTPLPALNRIEQGDSLVQARAKQKQAEAEQQRLLAELKAKENALPDQRRNPNDTPHEQQSGSDLAASALAVARLEAQIARQLEEYQQRPRKAFVGARAQEFRFAQYVEDWRIKVERVGNLNYPDAAKGRTYGSLRLTVSIRADGTVEGMEIERPSGSRVLDDAAKNIVRLAGRFAAFPPSLSRDIDILVITRTWTFSPGDRLSSD